MQTKKPLIIAHIYTLIAILIPLAIAVFCPRFALEWQYTISDDQRILIRSVLYLLCILGFPIINLLRHIQLRLSQTMPFENKSIEQIAQQRYTFTVLVSLLLLQGVSLSSFVVFLMADTSNNINILAGLACLGAVLYRPKMHEYATVQEALRQQELLIANCHL